MTLSRSVPSTLPPLPPLLERFRESWQTHNISALTELFTDDFDYIINGKKRFANKKQLRNYWCRNKLRQLDLDVVFSDATRRKKRYKSCFTASFFHPIALRMTVITGHMTIEADQTGQKICKLDETYVKIERFNPGYAFFAFYGVALRPVVRFLGGFVSAASDIIRLVSRYGLAIAFIMGLLVVFYTNFLHQQTHWISEEDQTSLKNYTLYWFGVSFLIQQILPAIGKKLGGDLNVIGFDDAQHQDLRYMADVMHNADHVTIVSGDFSFIDTNKKLEACLRKLAFSRKLTLISYKSRAVVEEEMSSKTSSHDILLKLSDEELIRYDFPVKAKITLVEHGGNRKMLFRFTKEIRNRPKLHMGFIRQTENTSALLDVLEEFLEKTGR